LRAAIPTAGGDQRGPVVIVDCPADEFNVRPGEVASPVTVGGSIALVVIGAILRFAVTWKPAHVDLQVIGVILMIAGVAGLIISVTLLVVRRRGRASAEVYEERRYTEPPA
jgi:uncharacterized membrane protein YedE/YeeE